MSRYDQCTLSQANRLTELLYDATCTALIWWGYGEQEKGSPFITAKCWDRGMFSDMIDAAMENQINARRLCIHTLAPDFVRAHDTQKI